MLINPSQTLETLQAKLGTLPQADLPAVLLPVRLETRFVTQASLPFLCVRIFPDDVHIDTHEPALTEDEIRWGQHVWEQAWRAGGDLAVEAALQTELAQRFGSGRAAWIAQALKPLNPEDRPAKAVAEGEPLPAAPRYPTPRVRPASWTQPPRVAALPDRWIVMGFRQEERVLTALSEPIAPSLNAGPDPQAPRPDNLDDHTVLPVDDGMRWMVDFDTAVEQGMALRIPLASMAEAERGYDRLLVFGLKANLDGPSSADLIESLLASHQFTDSLAFVPQGTPSNNTAEALAGYSALEPDLETDLLSRRHEGMATDANGSVTAQALGIAPAVFSRAPHSTEREQTDARAMNTVLWPATWGYLLRYGLNGLLNERQIAQTRQHFCEFVRGRGPLPAFRVGRQPYGLLPVTRLERYQPGADARLGSPSIALLRNLRGRWQRALAHVPQAGRPSGETPGQTLANILGMQATHVQLLARMAFESSLYGVFAPPGLSTPSDASLSTRHNNMRRLLQDMGVENVPADLPFARLMFTDTQQQIQDWLGEFARNGANLAEPLLALQQASFAALQDNALADLGRFEQTPFYLLLRHALLLAYAEVAYQIRAEQGTLPTGAMRDPGLVDVLSAEGTSTPLRLLTQPPAPDQPPLGATIPTLSSEEQPAVRSLEEVRQSLAHLATVPAERLDLLLRETLDLASHRLDAWITSLATARLHQMRQTRPQGLILGGYGWVENLRLEAGRPVTAPPSGVEVGADSPLFEQVGNGGYVAAPSLTQASTAAILRAGYLNHGSQNATDPFAIDLSSERVRLAQWLLAGVRQGQSLGALLGYRFERSLKENGLAEYIQPFRKLAPLGELYEKLAARDDAAAAKTALEQTHAQERADAQKDLQDFKELVRFYDIELQAINRAISQKESRLSSLNRNHPNIPAEIAALEASRTQLINQRNQVSRDLDSTPVGTIGNIVRKQLIERYNQLSDQIAAITQQINALQALQAEKNRLPGEINSLKIQRGTVTQQFHGAQNSVKSQEGKIAVEIPTRQAQELAVAETQLQNAQTAYDTVLKAYREKFLYPPTAEIEAIESIEAQHGVDGLALMNLWKAGKLQFGKRGLPGENSEPGKSLQGQLHQLVAMVDAVSDLVTAESVYQLAQGNELRAGATLDAIATGETPPPEPEVISTPRTGIAHTHRLAVVLPAAPTAPAQWKVDSFQRRAEAEPVLNAWVAELLVDPARVRIEATYLDPATEAPLATRSARLGDFMLSPLDALYLATLNETGTGSALDAQMAYRLLRLRPSGVPVDALVRFSYDPAPGWTEADISLGTFLEIARAVRDLVTASRPLEARDLALPESTALQPQIDLSELQRRADTAVNHLRNAQRHLEGEIANAETPEPNLDRLRGAFSRLYFLGFPEAVPLSAQGNDAPAKALLLEQATPLLASVNQRLTALESLEATVDRHTASPATLVELDTQRLQKVFGPDFRVLPQFQPPDLAPLRQAWENSLSLQGDDPLAAIAWLDQMAHVRDGCQRLHTSLTYAEALDDTFDPALTVGQLPYTNGDRWVALPQTDRLDSPRTALATLLPKGIPTDGPLTGLMIDEWVETIPNAEEMAGVAFHFDAPQAQAPHAILLAVPPNGEPRWTLETLGAIVQETLDLAKLRTVDNAALFEEPGSLPDLPALYLATNPNGDTLSTDLTSVAIGIGTAAPPRLTRISPSTVFQGRTTTLTLEGSLLADATAIQFSGTGITVHSLEAQTDQQLQVRLTVSSNATLSNRSFQVTTPLGILNSPAFGLSLQIRQAPPPPIHYGSFGSSAIGSNLL